VQVLPPTAGQQQRNEALAASRQQRWAQEAAQLQQQQHAALAAQVGQLASQAASRFWELLADFEACRAAPRKWAEAGGVPADHPFLRPVNGAVAVHRPAAPQPQQQPQPP
jgi:hypothetical protein